MKQLVLFSMMCLSTMFAQAQVITSETVCKTYEAITTADQSDFSYNGEFDDNGRMMSMTVYSKSNRKGQVDLKPSLYYMYEYADDGLLKSRTRYQWTGNEWCCSARYDYSLSAQLYTVAYSRWNKKDTQFDAVAEKIEYNLLPDNTITQINYYHRERSSDSLQLAWQLPVIFLSDHTHFMTQK